MTNTLKETTRQGDFGVIRPGIRKIASGSGNGNGLVSFNDVLLSVYGSNLGFAQPDSIAVEQSLIDGATLAEVVCGTYGGGIYCVLGFQLTPSQDYFTITSSDAVNWTVNIPPVEIGFRCPSLAYGNGVFVTFVNTQPYTSPNGVDWTIGGSTVPIYTDQYGILSFVGGKFYATTSVGTTYYTSTDGANWSSGTTPITAVTFVGDSDIVCAKGRSGGDVPKVCYSTDAGASWNTVTLPSVEVWDNWRFLVYSDGVFFAVAQWSATIYSSTDCITWTAVTQFTPQYVTRVHWAVGSDNYIAVYFGSDAGEFISVSYDRGVSWVEVTSANFPGGTFYIYAMGDAILINNYPSINDMYTVWTDREDFRSLQALSGDFFDFAQSTL